MTIQEMIYRHRTAKKIALIFGDEQVTYEQLWYYSQILSSQLRKDASSNVAIYINNSIDYVIAYLGIIYARKTVVPIDVNLTPKEIQSVLQYCDVNTILTTSSFSDTLKKKELIEKYKIIDIKQQKYIHGNVDLFKAELGDIEDTIVLLHTSGTTDRPKRVMLTNKNLSSNIISNVSSLNLKNSDITLIALPMYFGYCHTAQLLTHLYLGATIVIYDGLFLPKHFCELVQKYKVTNFTGVPTMLQELLAYRYSKEYDLSSLEIVCFGGGKMSIEKLNQLINKYTEIKFIQTYGQTECSPRVTLLPSKYMIKKLGSVGKPIPGVKICIKNKEGQLCVPNGIGEICVYGDNVMKGYYKCPTDTEKTIENGWLHTGDLGYLDDDGFLYLKGRIKNIIISGGINIYPEEIEGVLLGCPYIKDAYVYGVEDELLGEVPIAEIIVHSTVPENILSLIDTYCKENIALYKIPKKFIICEFIRKTYNGKTKRNPRKE